MLGALRGSGMHTQRLQARIHRLGPRAAAGARAAAPRRRAVAVRAAAPGKAPSSATEAVEAGLSAFNERKDYEEARRLFEAAMELQPSDEEAIAALYNLGCAHAKQRRWAQAADAIGRAINDYNLKLSVALKDPDLRELRDTRDWLDMLTTTKGGMSRGTKVNLRSEAKAPFRFARIVLFGGLAAGAGVGLIVIIGRLVAALRGGDGAPDLAETLRNLAINGAAVAGLGLLLARDLAARGKDVAVTEREEALSRLLVRLSSGRALPLIRFRGAVRPVIVAGDRSFVERAVRAAEPCQDQLRARGVSVVPVVYGTAYDPDEKLRALKRELRAEAKAAKGFARAGAAAGGAGAAADADSDDEDDAPARAPIAEADKRWRLEAALTDEWEAWIEAQKEFAGLDTARRNCWLQVQLDGTVARSGVGAPPWERLVETLPPLDSVRTQMTDGIGTDV